MHLAKNQTNNKDLLDTGIIALKESCLHLLSNCLATLNLRTALCPLPSTHHRLGESCSVCFKNVAWSFFIFITLFPKDPFYENKPI